MEKFEYCVRTADGDFVQNLDTAYLPSQGKRTDYIDVEFYPQDNKPARLSKMGDDGWELMHVTDYQFIFKRRKPEGS